MSFWASAHCKASAETLASQEPDRQSKIIFMGSGSSTGTPRPFCVYPDNLQLPKCRTSRLALSSVPELNKNYRGNPALLIQTAQHKNIQIDVGKTFRENVVRWYPRHNVNSLDAVILTHGHADAFFGLDDLRGLQAPGRAVEPLKVFVNEETLDAVRTTFPYLALPPPADATVKRWVASLAFPLIRPFEKFEAAGLELVPVPVVHGEDCICMGFVFGERERVVYLSDVSRVPPETENYLLGLGQIDVLIVDALFKERKHPTHFSLPESLEFIRKVKPKRAFLIGMSDDIEHEAVSTMLAQVTDVHVELSYDGLAVNVNL